MRTVTVALRALNSQFDQAYSASSKKPTELATSVQRSGALQRQSMQETGRGAVAMGALIVGGLAVAEKAAMDFNAQMSLVKTLSHATEGEMRQLRSAALTMGQAFGFSATQVAEGEAELVKAGIAVNDILGGALQGTLTLAAAGQLSVADATTIAASAMTQFSLKGKDVPHIADLLAAGADKALGSVQDLGTGLSSAGTVANQMGWSLDQTVGTLAEFAQNAQIGEKGGTLLRQMLLQLAGAQGQAKALMDKYNLSLYDNHGHMVDSSTLAGRLQASFGGLDEATRNHALTVIFGAHAIQGANILMKDGAAVNADWVKSVNDSGFAAEQASGKMDNLKGDVTKLGAAFQKDLIDSGTKANGALRGSVQTLTGLLNLYGDLPGPVQAGATATIILTGAVISLSGAALVAQPRLAAMNAQILGMTKGGFGLAGALGRVVGAAALLGGAIFLVDGAITKWNDGMHEADDLLDKLSGRKNLATTEGLSKAISDLTDFNRKQYEAAGGGNVLSSSWSLVTGSLFHTMGALEATDGGFDQLITKSDQMGQNLADLSIVTGKSYNDLIKLADAAGIDLSGNIQEVTSQLVGYINSTQKGGPATEQLAGALTSMGDAATDAKGKADGLKNSLDALIGVHLTADEAADSYQGKLRELTKTMKENGHSLDGTTEKGAKVKGAIRDVIQATLDLRDAQAREGASTATQRATMEAGRAALERIAHQYGLTKGQLNAYLKRLGDTPATVKTVLTVEGQKKALAEILDLQTALNNLPDHTFTKVMITAVTGNPGAAPTLNPKNDYLAPLFPGRHSGGGQITGPGSGTSDSILSLLSNGEFVVNAKATATHLPLLKAINDAPHFATGGLAGTSYSPSRGSLSSQATSLQRRGGGIEEVQALLDSYNAYLAMLARVAEREQDVADLRTARADRARAKTAADRTQADQAIRAAQQRLATFERDTAVGRQQAAADKIIHDLEKRAAAASHLADVSAHLAEIEDNRYTLGLVSASAEEASLNKRMAGVEKYSNAWMQLYQQLQQVKGDAHQAALDTVTFVGASGISGPTMRADGLGKVPGLGTSGGQDNSRSISVGQLVTNGTSAKEVVAELAWLGR